jgi:hypothetical protein
MAKKTETQEIVVESIDSPTKTLKGMRMKDKFYFPNSQRISVRSTITTLKDKSTKRFSLKRINDEYTLLRRTK